jgi:hypothetical protein
LIVLIINARNACRPSYKAAIVIGLNEMAIPCGMAIF